MLAHLSDSELQELHTLMQQHKLPSNEKRRSDVIEHSYSTKFLMHIVRLALECEQLLLTGELDLQRDSQTLLSIRRGEWTLEQGKKWWEEKERALETAYTNCRALPHVPNEAKIKELLLDCLSAHYGDISTAIKLQVPVDRIISDLQLIIDRYR